MKEKFESFTQTKSGITVKNIKFNPGLGKYLGFAADPMWIRDDQPFVTCIWSRNGKCANKGRPELDLI